MPLETSLKCLTTAISLGILISSPWLPKKKGWLLGAFMKWLIGPNYYK